MTTLPPPASTLSLAAALLAAGAPDVVVVAACCNRLPESGRGPAADRANRVLSGGGDLAAALTAAHLLPDHAAALLAGIATHPDPAQVAARAADQLAAHQQITDLLRRTRRGWTLAATGNLALAAATGYLALHAAPDRSGGVLAALVWLPLTVFAGYVIARSTAPEAPGRMRQILEFLSAQRWSRPPTDAVTGTWCHAVAHLLTAGHTWSSATQLATSLTEKLWGTGPDQAALATQIPALREVGAATGDLPAALHAYAQSATRAAQSDTHGRAATLAGASLFAFGALLSTYAVLLAALVPVGR